MKSLNIESQTRYRPELAEDYNALFASLHLTDQWQHNKDDIEAVCKSATSTFYLAMLAERAVAMAVMIHPVVSMGHRTAIFEDFATNPEFQGRGIGSHLLDYLQNEATSMGATRIELHSRKTRETAQRLYKKHGFEVIDTDLFRKKLNK